MERKKPTGDIPALTMARFLAALGVVWYHFLRDSLPDGVIRNAVASGYCGVPFFFILSGFILTFVYSGRQIRGPGMLRDFALRRFARIYPVYAFAWLLFGAWTLVNALHASLPLAYVGKLSAVFGSLSLGLVQAWVPGAAERWNWPGWSLSVEALFYALFPLLLVAVSRLSRASVAGWLIAALAINAVVTVATVATTGHPLLAGTPLSTTVRTYTAELPISNLPLFVMGICLARLFLAGLTIERRARWLAVVSIAIAATLAAGPDAHVLGVSRDVLFAPEFAALIYLLALIHGSADGVGSRVAVLLGKSSYALYIIQLPCYELFRLAVSPGTRHFSVPVVVLFTVLLVALSVIVHLGIEVPAERWIKRRASERSRYTIRPSLGTAR